jgi:hypothetical protein
MSHAISRQHLHVKLPLAHWLLLVLAIHSRLVSSEQTLGRAGSEGSADNASPSCIAATHALLTSGSPPRLSQPRLQCVFFSTRHTVSFEQDAASCNATTRSASNCSVQCSRPSGGGLHASAIRRAPHVHQAHVASPVVVFPSAPAIDPQQTVSGYGAPWGCWPRRLPQSRHRGAHWRL